MAETQEPAALRRRVDHVAEPADLRHHAKRGVEDKKLVAPVDIEVFGRVHRPRRGREPGKGERRKVARWMPRVDTARSEEHTSELQSLMRSSKAVLCLRKHTAHSLFST